MPNQVARRPLKRPKQTALVFKTWGGKRTGAGRKRIADRDTPAHRARPVLSGRDPLHVTLRVVRGLPTLRSQELMRVFWRACRLARARTELRVTRCSVQSDHVHLLVEADDTSALTRGMQGFSSRLARHLNAALRRRGKVFASRYDAQVLSSPRRVRAALVYVFQNARKHGLPLAPGSIDPYSSAAWFEGWASRVEKAVVGWPPDDDDDELPLAAPTTWLLRSGWRLRGGGPLRVDELPAAARP